MKLRLVAVVLLGLAGSLRADQSIENVQQALKDQGFYYGEITGQKDADTTAAIRRYQIRNGLQITGDLNDETLKALGIDASGSRPVVKSSPSTAPVPPESSELRAEPRESSAPTNPLSGQPFPQPQQDRQSAGRPGSDIVLGHPAENFAGTPYESAPPEVQRDVVISAQSILAGRGLYRGPMDGSP